MTKEQFRKYINNFEFAELFRINGWDNFTAQHSIEVQTKVFIFTGIVEKKSFPVLQIIVENANIPDLPTRKQIEKQIRNFYPEHLLVIIDQEKTWQYWQLPLREDGKLKKLVTFEWRKEQDVEGLFQKLRNIVFTLEEEDIITLADVKERVNTISANSEKIVTFYAEFTKQHKAFLAFIKGIDDTIPDTDNDKKQWYASLMMNRLMFCYFIQKKGFLDDNINYLRLKLDECKKFLGKNNFYGFYRSFLLELFHNELGRPEDKRAKNLIPVSFGKIPYLNGGLFDVHELERSYPEIAIKDEAFEKIFTFFDEWNWHLDTRITTKGKDINPDVIGYIFEKYINQKEMGAYYTKEDITDYIGKNTIIPFLLDKVKSRYSNPFEAGGGFWQYLQDSGDEYIYDAVKKGTESAVTIEDVKIPDNIRRGIDTTKPELLKRRKDWNTTTPEDIGLPTEIWRETIARLQRYFELKDKIKKGQIQEINDLITYNLNIRKLVQEYLEQTQDSKFIRNFYDALMSITILDPTCGSGAFLFAALNILEPLYEVCIQCIKDFHDKNPRGNTDFGQRIDRMHLNDQPNLTYYIYKTIILNNLYGVDIMKEAVEIAKLRLFLKLVAEVDPSSRKKNYGLEPLPDIDFNIRSGNTLVGFATEKQLEEVVRKTEGDLIYREKLEELEASCKTVSEYYKHFKTIQTATDGYGDEYKETKRAMSNKLKELTETLNRYLSNYGVDKASQGKSAKEIEKVYQQWKDSHQPFHWLAEFYEIISKGGFDIVIGNPPYVELSKVTDYLLSGYKTQKCGNLYAISYERALLLGNTKSLTGFIIPVASVCTSNYSELQNIWLSNGALFMSCFNDRPGKLFEGLEHIRLAIVLIKKSNPRLVYTTKYNKWNTIFRNYLFDSMAYSNIENLRNNTLLPKINNHTDSSIFSKIYCNKKNVSSFIAIANASVYSIFYTRKLSGFVQILNFIPKITDNEGTERFPSELKQIYFDKKEHSLVYLALFNSSLFYWYLTVWSDCRNLNKREIESMPFDFQLLDSGNSEELQKLAMLLMKDIEAKSVINKMGILNIQCTYPKKSKLIIDEIDKVLAKHYGFTEEELDFIINYDIKYRMGSELEQSEGKE